MSHRTRRQEGLMAVVTRQRWRYQCAIGCLIVLALAWLALFASLAWQSSISASQGALLAVSPSETTGCLQHRARQHSNAVSCPTGMVASRKSRLQPFHPVRDIMFNATTATTPLPYSFVRCVASGSYNKTLQTEPESTVFGDRPRYVDRSCYYRNIYYQVADQSFHYWASPTETALVTTEQQLMAVMMPVPRKHGKPVPFKNKDGWPEYLLRRGASLGHVPEELRRSSFAQLRVLPWYPKWHPAPDANFTNGRVARSVHEHLAFLLYQPFHSFNFGHLLWDDVMSLFGLLDVFDLVDRADAGQVQPVPFFVEYPGHGAGHGGFDPQWRCQLRNTEKWNWCVTMYRKLWPALLGVEPAACNGDILRTGNWLRGAAALGAWPDAAVPSECRGQSLDKNWNAPPKQEYVLLPQLLVGTGRLGHYGCHESCAIGRSARVYRFRQFLWNNIMRHEAYQAAASRPVALHHDVPVCLPSPEAPSQGYITFSLPIGSSRPDEVYHFATEIVATRAFYGDDRVRVVNMAELSIAEQARLMHNTAVLLTNHGGGSAVSLFLSRGAAIVLFWHGETRRDYAFFESVGYFRITWIGVTERLDINRTMTIVRQELAQTELEWKEAT